MSIWDWISGAAKPLSDKVTDVAQHTLGIPDAAERRNQAAMMNDQVKAYKEQSELTRTELNKAKDAQNVEQRRIQEKQIRTLRRNYRPAGILGQGQQSSQADVSTKLGG